MEAAVERQAVAGVKPSLRTPNKNRSGIGRGAEQKIQHIYGKLADAWGPQHWWPAETPFEVILGAILTQNTSWTNVERALASLRQAGGLSLEGIRNISIEKLEPLLRSSGYFRQKAQRVKDFVAFVDAKHRGSLETMFATGTEELRLQLLERKGIGRETADSILLYAGLHPVFVVDAYTRRIFERHEIVTASAAYDDIRQLVEHALVKEDAFRSSLFAIGQKSTVAHSGEERMANSEKRITPPVHAPSAMSTAQRSMLSRVYNEMHGLIVQVGKHYCHKTLPECERCPLGEMLSPKQRLRLQTGGSKPIRGTTKVLPVKSS